jgi:hypothetical protein
VSGSILSLVEQRYKKKAELERQLLLNKLHKEVENVPVMINWLSPKTKKLHRVEGHVSGVSWIPGRPMSFAIKFVCPETSTTVCVPRETAELS